MISIQIIMIILVLALMPPNAECPSRVDNCTIYNNVNDTIDCTNRNLTNIPIDEINQMNAIVLNFDNNYLKFSPDNVKQLMDYRCRNKVTKILLSNNCIENVPDLSDALPNLMTIDLRSNVIKMLKKTQFFGFKNLKTVCLDDNPLKDKELENLKTTFTHLSFTCETVNANSIAVNKCEEIPESTSNYTVSENPFEDNVTASNTTEGDAKNSVSEESPTTNSNSLSTNPVDDVSTLKILLIVFGVVGAVLILIFAIICVYNKKKTKPKDEIDETEIECQETLMKSTIV